MAERSYENNGKDTKNQRYVAPSLIKAVQYCIAEQEREKNNGHGVPPLPGVGVSGHLRNEIKNTVLAQPAQPIVELRVTNIDETVFCRRLNSDNQVIETFKMNRKTAREIVRKGQGEWVY